MESHNLRALLEYNEVATVVPLDQVNGSAYARDASPNDYNGGIAMVLVPDWNLRIGFVAGHSCAF